MARVVYVPELGRSFSFKDGTTDREVSSFFQSKFPSAPQAAPQAAVPESVSDESGILGRFAYGLGRGITDIPGGIASLIYPAEEAAKTTAGQISEKSRQYLEETLGIDPTKDPTATQMTAQALGSVASFLIPGTAAMKGVGLLGKGAALAEGVGTATAAAQGVALGAEQRSEKIRQQLASGMVISPEQQIAAQRLDGLIGASEALPLHKFFGPLQTILSKVPVSKAPLVERIIENRLGKITRAGIEEGAQEVASGVANDLVEYGIYNPNVQIGQDILSNAGTGAFAGSFVEGVIQLAAGRKAAPYRQLAKDIQKEKGENAEAVRQGNVAQAAENLRQSNISGPIDINEEEIDGLQKFTIKAPSGNVVATFDNRADAVEAVQQYALNTAADVKVREPFQAPEIFPVKIGKGEFNSIDEVVAARDDLLDQKNRLVDFSMNDSLMEAESKKKGVDKKFYQSIVLKQVDKYQKDIGEFDAFINRTKGIEETPTPEETSPIAEAPAAAPEEVTPIGATETPIEESFVPAEAVTPVPIETEAQAAELPIGAVEMPVEEQRFIEEAPAVITPEGEAPAGRTEMRPSATPEQLADLQTELFGQPTSVAMMTPEQRATYEAERDKRFPPEPVTVYYSGSPAPGSTSIPETTPMQDALSPREYTPERLAWNEEVKRRLIERLSPIVGNKARLEARIIIGTKPNYLIRGQASVVKTPDGIESLIELSIGILKPGMTVEAAVEQLAKTMNHEVIHVLRDLGLFHPNEWQVLSRAAAEAKVPGKKYTYLDKAETVYTENLSPVYANPEAVLEEAVAEMYKDWVTKREAKQNARGLFNRITEFFRRIFNTIKMSKYETVFKAIEAGKMRDREVVGRSAAESPRFSAAPALGSEEFKRWFRNSKVVNPDGTPKILYHGTDKSFTEFSREMLASSEFSYEDSLLGFMFTDNPSAASFFTGSKPKKPAGMVLPVNLSIQNPLIIDMASSPTVKIDGAPKFTAEELLYEMSSKLGAKPIPNDLINAMRERGFDGVHVLNSSFGKVTPGLAKSIGGQPGKWDVWIALDPEQIKSTMNPFEEGAATSPRFSAAPLPPIIEQRNRTLFREPPEGSVFQSISDFFLGPAAGAKTLSTQRFGTIDVSGVSRAAVSARTKVVDKNAIVEFLEKLQTQQETGKFELKTADYSATAAISLRNRSSHLNVSHIMMGSLEMNYATPGDIQSATLVARNSPDNMLKVFSTMLEPGPVDSVTGVQKDKREVFRTYATAIRARDFRAAGIPVPAELDNTYINTAIPYIQQVYPEIVDAYNMYQRVNKKMMETARDSGLFSDAELVRLTKKMNYYGFYRELHSEELTPTSSTKTAGKFDFRQYTGSAQGNLIDDPMFVIIQNMQYLTDSMAKNLAATKVFNLAKDMGEARLLRTGEDPDPTLGESTEVMFFRDRGVTKRFAVKDPLLVTALGADDSVDVGMAMKLAGLPTKVIRESVTRDPGFMIANLLRDTVASWITSGEDITPFVGTAKGLVSALKSSTSYEALAGRGAIGSYDVAMMTPEEMAATLKRRLTPANIKMVTSANGIVDLTKLLWDRLGYLSEASDAATRIAVYEAARKQGMSEAEATFRAIRILDFSRRGSSQLLSILTKVVPFLNARIQGLDVVYQAGASAVRLGAGKSYGEKDVNLGKKVLVRGAMLAALSIVLEMYCERDEEYKDIPDYVKTGNLLIPLKDFGLPGQFIAIPKAFEPGLIFSTFPQQLYKTATGQASGRENAGLFFSSFASTFGVNPVPQFLLPAVEVLTNHDFYTGLPLISEGKLRLAPEMQYDSRTSTIAMMFGNLPIKYNFDTGKFEGISPIVIDKLISGYGGPLGTILVSYAGMVVDGADIGPERLPKSFSQMPVIRRVFVDAETKGAKSVSDAYELFRIVDEANRTFSRLRQSGDAEAAIRYLEENKEALKYKKYVFKLVDRLNKMSAYERQIERDPAMSRDEKFEAMKQIREARLALTSQISQINKAMGR